MPAMTFGGDTGIDGREYRLFRAYAFTDRDCVNVVFRGSVVGGPAYAPRVSGPLKLPTNQEELDVALAGILPSAKSETAKTFMADGTPDDGERDVGCRRSRPRRPPRRRHVVDPLLLDGRPGRDHRRRGREFTYYDAESPQDACESGRMASFGKESRPVITTAGTPYVSGLSPKGRLLAQAGRRPSSTRRLSSPGDPWSARRHTRCSGRARSTRGGRADPHSRTRRRPCSSSAPGSGTTASAD